MHAGCSACPDWSLRGWCSGRRARAQRLGHDKREQRRSVSPATRLQRSQEMWVTTIRLSSARMGAFLLAAAEAATALGTGGRRHGPTAAASKQRPPRRPPSSPMAAAASSPGGRRRRPPSRGGGRRLGHGRRPPAAAASQRRRPHGRRTAAAGGRRPPPNSETGHVDRPGRCPRRRIDLKLGMHKGLVIRHRPRAKKGAVAGQHGVTLPILPNSCIIASW